MSTAIEPATALEIQLACPKCGQTELSTIERLYGKGLTNGIWRDAQGNADIAWQGETDMDWDSSTSIGVECVGCGWWYEGDDWETKLVATINGSAWETRAVAAIDSQPSPM